LDSTARLFEKIVKSRRSVRIFDKNLSFNHDSVDQAIKWASLAPNSSNLQLWEFYRLKSEKIRHEAIGICLGQQAAKTARELVVFVSRRDLWRSRAKFNLDHLDTDKLPESQKKKVLNYYSRLIPFLYFSDPLGFLGLAKSFMMTILGFFKPTYREMKESDLKAIAHKSCALAAENFMLGMSAHGYGSCPMEGFDSRRLSRLLNLPKGAKITMVIAVGPVSDEGIYGKQLRLAQDQVQFCL